MFLVVMTRYRLILREDLFWLMISKDTISSGSESPWLRLVHIMAHQEAKNWFRNRARMYSSRATPRDHICKVDPPLKGTIISKNRTRILGLSVQTNEPVKDILLSEHPILSSALWITKNIRHHGPFFCTAVSRHLQGKCCTTEKPMVSLS